MTRAIEALLFDLGGVVIDIDPNRIFDRWAAHAGCDPAHVRSRADFDATHERYERGEIDIHAYFDHVRSQLGHDLIHDQLLDGWNAIFVGVMPGMPELLTAAAAHMPLYCLTNTNPAHEAFWAREYAGAIAPFRKIFVSSTIGMRKPDRVCFEHVVKEIGVPAPRILFFDDALENVEGARRCGLAGVHAPTTNDIRRALEGLEV